MSQTVIRAQNLQLVRCSHQMAQSLKRLHPETEAQLQKIETEIDKVGARVVRAKSVPRAIAALRRLQRVSYRLTAMCP